jgi:hypothetical protein
MAMQSAIEVVSLGADGSTRGYAVATNVFLRTPVGWRLLVHHASSVPAAAAPSAPEGPLH